MIKFFKIKKKKIKVHHIVVRKLFEINFPIYSFVIVLDPIKTYIGYTKIIKNNSNTNTNSVTINLDTKSSSSVEEQPFYISFKMNKCLFSAIGLLLLLLVMGIGMIILIIKYNTTDCTKREKIFLEEQRQLKKMIQNLENQLSEQSKEI